ncbi:class I SAM-dependent methyltransferase [Glycomyces luteolus]|uniref:Class I SAM-dependent methyltransferase n=1 Tax=Glycomyces luteolus TaxID=2670330 RepID=A0A9X3PB68_9ACTN|nr:class I SAM-dependent methyltransferase [Glycomyces luteolus]MDA1361479.1 class I SAM-dependent methyltransferase [Glycomyces luteolus]
MSKQIALDYAEHANWLLDSAHKDAERYRRLAADLVAPGDRRAADIGCGGGGMAVALAATVPEVVAFDADAAVLDVARVYADRCGAALAFALGDIESGPEVLLDALGGAVDLMWAGHVVHHAADEQAALATLAAAVTPGGRLAVAEGGIGARVLPWNVGVGRPGLQARLEAAGSERMIAENLERGAVPMPYGWTAALGRAGLTEVRTLNEIIDRPAPLEGAALTEALENLEARVGWFEAFLDEDDRAAWKTLLDPESPAWLGRRGDLHHLEVRSVYLGRKPKRG